MASRRRGRYCIIIIVVVGVYCFDPVSDGARTCTRRTRCGRGFRAAVEIHERHGAGRAAVSNGPNRDRYRIAIAVVRCQACRVKRAERTIDGRRYSATRSPSPYEIRRDLRSSGRFRFQSEFQTNRSPDGGCECACAVYGSDDISFFPPSRPRDFWRKRAKRYSRKTRRSARVTAVFVVAAQTRFRKSDFRENRPKYDYLFFSKSFYFPFSICSSTAREPRFLRNFPRSFAIGRSPPCRAVG